MNSFGPWTPLMSFFYRADPCATRNLEPWYTYVKKVQSRDIVTIWDPTTMPKFKPIVLDEDCAPRRVLELFSVKWTTMVLHSLHYNTTTAARAGPACWRGAYRGARRRCLRRRLLPIAITASSSSFWRRPVIETYAPSLANSFAVANPIPSVPPVMRAILSGERDSRHFHPMTLWRCTAASA